MTTISNNDIQLLELMASKICHDLISPVGAVSNGVEFLEEMGADAGEEVTGLIAYSAQQAAAKLKAFRMAYGLGGADDSIKPEDVHQSFEELVGPENKIRQNWDPHGPLNLEERPRGYSKMLMSLLLLATEALPKGGEITLSIGEGQSAVLNLTGEKVALRDYVEESLGLLMPVSDLEPKLVHAYITGLMARKYGFTLSVDQQGDEAMRFTMSW